MAVVAPLRTLCGGGTSSPQAGVAPVITLTAAGITAFLTPLIDPVAAELLAGVVAAALEIDVGNYCANDPPADPGLGPGDVKDAINFTNPAVQAPAVAKVIQWFLSQYWYNICKCDAGTQPTPPTLSNPGPASQNPGIPQANQSTPCWSQSAPWTIPGRPSGSANDSVIDLGAQLLPSGPSIQIPYGANNLANLTAYAIPTGVTKLHLDMHSDLNNNPQTLATFWATFTSAGAAHGQGLQAEWTGSGLSPNNSLLTIDAPSSGASYWAIWVESANLTQYTGTSAVSFYCSPNSTLVQRECCPPDQTLQTLITQIIGILNATQNNITTIQTDVTNIQTTVNTTSTNVTNLQTDVTNLQTDVTVLQTDVTNLQTTIDSETNTTITNVNTTVTATDTTVNTINTTVNEISAELTTNTTTVNNLQAFLAPLGYTLGTHHAGLTGEGSFGVTGLSGIFIHITTPPPYGGIAIGEPDYLFDVGWASVLDVNGFIDETRLHSLTQVWQPRLMSEATVIGYSLNPGTVADFAELLPKVGP